jgi:hypothetical protein
MKANYFLKTLVAMMLMCWVTTVNATDFTADDEASFLDALNQAAEGDKIIVSGDIVLTATVTIDKNVKIVSDDLDEPASAAFYGEGTKLFIINPPAEEGGGVLFQNIGFYDATSLGDTDDADGGAVRILSGYTEFAFCDFSGNYSDQDGGAVAIAGDDTKVWFFDSSFSGNKSGKRGGAFYIGGNSFTKFEYCAITSNGSLEDRGGGLFIDQAQVNFYYSLISGNAAGWTSLDIGENAATETVAAAGNGQGGGGICLNGDNASVTLDATAVIGNTAIRNGSHGGAIFWMGNGNLTLINSIVAQNQNRGAGSLFCATTTNTFTMVNSNWVANRAFDNAGNGAGIRIMNLGNNFNFFNSLVIGNWITQPGGATDITISPTAGIADNLVIKNSMIGLIHSGALEDAVFQGRISDNPAIATKSKVNYYNFGGETTQPDWMILDKEDGSGLDFADGIQATRTRKMSFYTYESANSYGVKLGDPALLSEYGDTDVDFLGKARAISGGAIAAGPLQGLYGDTNKRTNDPETPDFISNILDQTGISSPSGVVKDINLITPLVSNGVVGVNFGELHGQAKGELISLNGQVVDRVFNTVVVGKGYYNVNAAPGVYILKVTIEGQIFAKRLIVK